MMDALLKRLERARRDVEIMPAQIAACVVNFSMGHPKKPVSPKDFMPSEWARNPPVEKKPKRRKRQLIATEIRATMDAWLRNQNG
jgi:hypothetical protein